MTGWLFVAIAGCITDAPQPRPETSDEMIAELPTTPPAEPSTAVTPEPGPVEVTMNQVRGTPPGTKVMVDGFFDLVEHGHVVISADSEGKTLHLRCEGGGTGPVEFAIAHTPVRVTGVVEDAVADDTVVLTGCSTEVTGPAPVDLARPKKAQNGA